MTLRVLHALEALEGGTARHLVDLVRNTPGVAHDVALPSRRVGGVTDTAATAAMERAGARVHVIEMRRRPLSWRNATALASLRVIIRSVRPDVVHGHSSIGGTLARVAAIGCPAAKVYTPNGLAPGRSAAVVERALGRLTDRLVAVSVSEGHLVLELGLVDPTRLAVIPNGIDLDISADQAVDLRRVAGIPAGAPLVGCIARLLWQKDPVEFVRVCAAISARRPDVHYLLVGSGPLQSAVDTAVRDARLGQRWHQLTAVPLVANALGQIEVMVLPSRFEGGPYAPLEALRAGTPVVLSDCVGNRDVVEDGISGAIVAAGDTEAMATEVVRLLDDPHLARARAAAGRARLRSIFDVREMGQAHVRLYQEVSRSARGPVEGGYHQPGTAGEEA